MLTRNVVLTLFALVLPAQLAGADEVDWKADLDYVTNAIESIHPNPWHRITREELHADATDLRKRLPGMNDEETAVALAGLVATLQDGHTRLDLRELVDFSRWFPVRLERFPDGIGITAIQSELSSELLGSTVLEMFGEPATEVWDHVESISPGDNLHSRMANTPLYLLSPAVMKALGYGEGDALPLEIEKGGKQRRVTLRPVEGPPWFFGGPHLSLAEKKTTSGDLSFRNLDSAYTTWLDREEQLLYVRIDQINDADGPVVLDGNEQTASLDDLREHVFSLIDGDQANKVVIDLRRNGGGNNSLAIPIVEGIVSRPALNVNGRLFVLTDGTTFSAAMNLVSLLESRTEAIFVGEAPGGSPLHYGDAKPVSLPSSDLQLFISTLHWDLGVSPWDVRDVMEPDISAPMTLEALRNGTDPALDAVRSFATGSILSDELISRYEEEGIDAALEIAATAASASTERWNPVSQHLTDFGWKLIRQGASGKAIYSAFERATELRSDDFYTWFTLGRIYMWPGRWEDARKAFAHARTLRPSNQTIARMTELALRRSEEESSPETRNH